MKWRASTAISRPLPGEHIVAPVDVEVFNDGLAALNAPQRFAIAVSGGRDSMALMRLCAAYARRNNAEVLALSVDHGLRKGSEREAAQTALWCKAAGLHHQTLKWSDEKPSSGVQAAARAARYRLLTEAAAMENCTAILTAHSASDQAETFFMRLMRGGGVRGLAAMKSETLIAAGAGNAVRLLRPLLPFSRAQLTATVDDMGQAYIDDPSNDDPLFERVRVRALLAGLEENKFLTGAALIQAARRSRASAARLQRQEDELFMSLGGCFYSWGGVSIDGLDIDQGGMAGLCSRLIHAVGGEEYRPEEAAALSAAAKAAQTGAATLAGALIKYWKERLWFMREPGAVLGRAGVPAFTAQSLDGPVLWDNRFILSPLGRKTGLSVAPVGAHARAPVSVQAPPEAFSTSPGIYQQETLIGAPLIPSMPDGGVAAELLAKERFFEEIIRFS